MIGERDEAVLAVKFKAIRSILLAILVFFLAATLLIGGMAWLLNLTGIGLSLDTRFVMATMIFCTLVFSSGVFLLGVAITYRNESLAFDQSSEEDDLEYDEEEIANRIIAKVFEAAEADDQYVRNRRTDESTAKPRRHSVKSAASRKRR